ncbi:MAG: EAL domain-containing protein [Proteobacteria bacterium]|nr:EAL domain-containing protein [Pseudomonadota bacterium]
MEDGSSRNDGANLSLETGSRHIRVLRTLNACSRVVIRATDEMQLLDAICNTMVTEGGYTHSWIGYAIDDAYKTVRPMAKVGFHAGNVGIDNVSWDASRAEGNGVFGNSIRSGKPAVIRDAMHSPAMMTAWSHAARLYNYNSVLGLPLAVQGKVIGAIGFYSSESDRFDPQEIELLAEVASDLAYGISVIRLRKQHDIAQAKLEEANHALELRIRERTEALRAEKERVTVTLESIADGVITTDITGRIDYLNPVAERLTAWKTADAKGKPLREVFHILDDYSRMPIPNPVETVLQTGETVALAGNAVLIGKHGKEFAIEETAAPIRDSHGVVRGVVLAFHDVSRSRQIAAQLSYQATHDELTGLVNRREFETRLQQAVHTATVENKQHAFLYIDLDQFKLVNDTSGHAAGDELLCTLSSLLQSKLRAGDTLSRLGGDEFGILLENCAPTPAAAIAETLRETVHEFRFVWQDKSFVVGLSIGVVNFSNDGMTVSDIFSAADTACYLAKESGRNRVHVCTPDDKGISIRRGEMQWVSRIQAAIEQQRLQLFCQKIVPLGETTEVGAHFELLLRLCDEEGKIVPPGAFLPAAERFGIMPELDRWVIETAFANFDKLTPDANEQLAMCAINLSGGSISDEHFLPFILQQRERYRIPAHKICFEITETVAIANLSQATHFINELRAIGCRFALDDFGSGMSSFAYLKHLPVDYLKIDGGFVKDMVHDAADAAMVDAINRIGHTMGLKTIAEFVEDDAILAMLVEMQVDYAQGYGIGKPVPCRLWAKD